MAGVYASVLHYLKRSTSGRRQRRQGRRRRHEGDATDDPLFGQGSIRATGARSIRCIYSR